MKKIVLLWGIVITSLLLKELQAGEVTEKLMRIKIQANGVAVVYELNNSSASKNLYAQLPLKINIEDYGGKEKIFYPPAKLNLINTPLANAGHGLYELGKVVSGKKNIEKLSGIIEITAQINEK